MSRSEQIMEAAHSPQADQLALVDFLRERDIACPLCDYNLRGLTSPRCPECGRELRLSVGLVEPRQGAWLTAEIAFSAAAGIGFIAIASIIMHGWPQMARRQWLFNIAFTYYMAAIVLAAGCFFARRHYLRLTPQMQWGIALAAAAASAMSIATMFLTD